MRLRQRKGQAVTILKQLIFASAALVATPLTAASMTTQQAFAECRAKYAHLPDIAGSGNPVKEATIEACAREKMSQKQQSKPAPRPRR